MTAIVFRWCYVKVMNSNFHRLLVASLYDGFLYRFCSLAESYETINQFIINKKDSIWLVIWLTLRICAAMYRVSKGKKQKLKGLFLSAQRSLHQILSKSDAYTATHMTTLELTWTTQVFQCRRASGFVNILKLQTFLRLFLAVTLKNLGWPCSRSPPIQCCFAPGRLGVQTRAESEVPSSDSGQYRLSDSDSNSDSDSGPTPTFSCISYLKW